MGSLNKSNFKLGIIAGGQLGKMLIQEASKWDIISYVLDPSELAPASGLTNEFFQGDYRDYNAVYNLGRQVDLLTYEIENINVDALHKLKSEGVKIIPEPRILELIQDKGKQKEFYREHDIPTSDFSFYENKEEIVSAIKSGDLKTPFVQKVRQGGYDGRGVEIINNDADIDKIMDTSSLIEEKVNIQKELAVIAARNSKGEIKCFPVVDMVFDSRANLLNMLICPVDIDKNLADKAEEISTRLIDALDMEGLLAVELFLDKDDNILVNEVAPRTHNSGHHTIESIVTSQFEQHLRAILDLPLGSTKILTPAVMINLLGAEGFNGSVCYEGLVEAMAIEGVNIHLYGKKETRPFRKMGHVTVVSDDINDAINKAKKVKELIKVKSCKTN